MEKTGAMYPNYKSSGPPGGTTTKKQVSIDRSTQGAKRIGKQKKFGHLVPLMLKNKQKMSLPYFLSTLFWGAPYLFRAPFIFWDPPYFGGFPFLEK